jgi:threonine/homoserine/homoserine lactone efflux protein
MSEPLPLRMFVVATVVMLVLPGPAVLFVIARSIGQGRRAGFVAALGVACGALVHTFALLAGLAGKWVRRRAGWLRAERWIYGGTLISLGMIAACSDPNQH